METSLILKFWKFRRQRDVAGEGGWTEEEETGGSVIEPNAVAKRTFRAKILWDL